MRIIVHLFLLLALSSFSFAADKTRSEQEEDISEAVFRHQFENNASYQKQGAKGYYLATGEQDKDPSDEFMKRFAKYKPPVHKVSASTTVNLQVVDKKSGEKGLIFRVRIIKWISDSEVEVKGGYSEHGLSASSNTYKVTRKDGAWKVVKDKVDLIS